MNRLYKYFDDKNLNINANPPMPDYEDDESEDKPKIIIFQQILDVVRTYSLFAEGIRIYAMIEGKEFSYEFAEDKLVSEAFDKMAKANMPPECSRVIIEREEEE